MEIKDLKDKIENKKALPNYLVFKYVDNPFLAKQYAQEIAKNKGLVINYIESIAESANNNCFFSPIDNKSLNILITDKFETEVRLFSDILPTIVICKSINDNLISHLKLQNVLVEFPKIESWQVKAYMEFKAQGLSKDTIEWLYNVTNGDIYRIENELEKFENIEKEKQQQLFNKIKVENGYSDLSDYTIFSLINSIMKRDGKCGLILKEIDNIDVEPYGLITLLYNNLKNVIKLQISKNPTPESTNLQPKQFQAIKYNCGKYSNSQLIDMFEFISELDYRLKNGELKFLSNSKLIEYIIYSII